MTDTLTPEPGVYIMIKEQNVDIHSSIFDRFIQ